MNSSSTSSLSGCSFIEMDIANRDPLVIDTIIGMSSGVKSQSDAEDIFKYLFQCFSEFSPEHLRLFQEKHLPILLRYSTAQQQQDLCLEFARWHINQADEKKKLKSFNIFEIFGCVAKNF